MTRTATDQALHIIERGLTVAERDGSTFSNRNIKVSPKGYYFVNGQRASKQDAVQALAHVLNEEAIGEYVASKTRTPAGPMTFERLNKATQDFFYELAEQIQTVTKDAKCSAAVRLGHDIPKVQLVNAPRLTNLKKVGLVETVTGEKKTHRMLRLTERGQAVWAAHA